MQAPASSSCLGFAADITHTCMLLKSNNMAVSCAPCVTSPASLQIRLPQSTVESQPPLSPPGGRSYVMLQLQAYPITPSAAADFSLFPWDNASSCLSWGRRPGPSRDGQHRSPAGERGIIWNDPTLAIPWPIETPRLSDRDQAMPTLAAYLSAER